MIKRGAMALAILCLTALPVLAEDIVVTQYKADPSGAPFGVAIERGFFKTAGVEITDVISGEGGGSSVRNVIASSLGYGDVSPAPVIAAIRAGEDVKIVNIGTNSLASNVVVVMPNSPIRGIQDLKGKKWGISNPKSLGELVAVLTVEKAGLAPQDVQRVALGSLTGVLTAMESGLIDVTAVPAILFRTRGGDSKYRVILRPQDLPLVPTAIGIATGDLMKKHPDKLRAILAGRRDGVRFINEHPQEAATILGPVWDSIPQPAVDSLVSDLAAARFYSEGRIELEPLQTVVRAMRYVGMLDGEVDLAGMIDRSFLPKDLF
ncbi:MAG TPA: ABC transporter substrate-binding protein [Alphaproteobacteria bacterium]